MMPAESTGDIKPSATVLKYIHRKRRSVAILQFFFYSGKFRKVYLNFFLKSCSQEKNIANKNNFSLSTRNPEIDFIFTYSAIGCLVPFLSVHIQEIGITPKESASINTISALVSICGPLLAVPVAFKYNKFRALIVLTLVFAGVFYTSLLFVPKVIRTPRHPQVLFDCTNNALQIEQCPDWEGDCNIHPKRPSIGNFTNFTLTKCRFVCATNVANDSWYPIEVCFSSASEKKICLQEDSESDKYSTNFAADGEIRERTQLHTVEAKVDSLIQFDSRFDRWPLLDSNNNAYGKKMCSFQPSPPLIVNRKTFEAITCHDSKQTKVHECVVHCNVNMLHRPFSSPNSALRPPVPCYDLTGNPRATFYSYLIFRCCADLALFTSFTLIDALSIAFTNNFDSLYGGLSKVATIAIPLSIWSPLCGYLVDFYSTLAGFSDYAPPFILFDGMILISCALAIALPIAPFTSPILSIQSQTSVRSLNNCRRESSEREKVPLKSKCVLVFLFPVVLILGTQWGLLETYLLPFYLQMNSSKLWIGLSFTITFVAFAPFALVIKSMTSAVGRSHLIILGFVFYTLRLSGISFLSKPKWTLIPFEAMEAFTLPITWIGITSYCHHLIQRSSRSAEMLRNGVSSSTSTHLILHTLLIVTHFGIGRALGTFCWALWDWRWIDDNHLWRWLTEAEIDDSSYSFRVLLRLMAIISLVCSVVVFSFYHICCKYRPRKPSKRQQHEVQTPVVLNGVHYSRLVEKEKVNANDVQVKQTNGDTSIKMIDAPDDENY